MAQNNQDYIISVFKKLNEALEALNNEIIVLDFSHFSPLGKDDKYDIYFKSLASTEEYKSKYYTYISNFVRKPESIWRKYENGKQRLLYNFDNANSYEANKHSKDIFINEELNKSNVTVQKDFNAKEHLINDFPQTSLLPGKCFIMYTEEHGEAQSIVYVLLREKIPIDSRSEEPEDLLRKLPENLKGFDTELQSLLIHEMVNSLVEEKTSLYQQVQDLKTQTMFSLTTHSLKTHLNTTVIKEKNAFLDKLGNHNKQLKEDFEKYLGKEVDTLFRLTEILSLVDKINDKQKFIDAAKGTELLSESIVTYDLKEHLIRFNRRKNIERTEPDIKICSTANLEAFTLQITIYSLYLGKDLIELLFNTIFENIVVYGKPESGYRNLVIEVKKNQIAFSNQTLSQTIQLDETKLTGNYGLFKKLLENTNSGQLSIPSVTDHEFKLIIKYGI